MICNLYNRVDVIGAGTTPGRRLFGWIASCILFLASLSLQAQLTTVEYRVGGTALQVSPAAVAVPKGIAGSVRVDLTGGDTALAAAQNSYVEATLRGPGLPEPRKLVGAANQPLLFPPLNLVGDYQLTDIRLVRADTGETIMDGTPNLVPVRVFDEVLVSRVTSRPLTLDEIQEKGIFIDESNFRAVEFEAAFVLDGKTIPIRFPVISPKFKESTELIPAAELEAKLAEAAVLNAKIASDVVQLPPEFQTAQLNIEIQGVNFQAVDPADDAPLSLRIPPIPALMVIPGNIGYLHQFFSVQIFTENASPTGSGLSVRNVKASLKLPSGPDRIPATNYATPGDDPLRFARVGPQKIIQPEQTLVQPGPDGKVGTADDVGQLGPGESGQAEFLVEGLQEGLHVLDLDLMADLDGLAAGPVKVKGKAAGSVLVRNPRFSMAFSHPRTVRAGEPYDASVTLLNTGNTPANLVQVSLNKNSISGARLEDESLATVQLGNILPGQTATARFRMRSLRTGSVQFSNLTTSDDSVEGRFRLSMGVDERGVALSPDTIGMPDYVTSLPESVQFAATRVLGQALSIATAGQLPAGVQGVPKGIVTRRVLELAEAGQRLRYKDPLPRVLADLLLDWQGGREANLGFDQILRETDAGREWREALFAALRNAEGKDATTSLLSHAGDFAGLGQPWVLGSANVGNHSLTAVGGTNQVVLSRSEIPYDLVYGNASNGVWSATRFDTNRPVVLNWTTPTTQAQLELGVVILTPNGTGQQLRWSISNSRAGAMYRFDPNAAGAVLQVDADGDGTFEGSNAGVGSSVSEIPPTVIAVEQDTTVNAGRPFNPCVGPTDIFNYGTVVAVVFSKPMTQASAGNEKGYTLDGNNSANSAQLQPGGRVVYLNLRKGISAIRPRTFTFQGITDARSNSLVTTSLPVHSVSPGTTSPFVSGVAVRGRVLRANGQPAGGVPVTLTMYDRAFNGLFCDDWTRRVSQVITDDKGAFDFDFVLAGIPYSVSATDTSTLSPEALAIIAEATAESAVDRQRIEELATSDATRDTLLGAFAAGSLPQAIARVEGLDRALIRDVVQPESSRIGQEVPISLRFRGRAIVSGQVFGEDGVSTIAGAAVNLFPDLDSREQGRGILSDEQGRFAFYGVPLGVFSVEVATSDRRGRTISGVVSIPDQVTNLVITLPSLPTPYAHFRGRVFDSDNITPLSGARVFLGNVDGSQVRQVVRILTTDADGNWSATNVPLRSIDVVAVSFDGKRKGVRQDIRPQADVITVVNVALEATTRVFGRVQFEDGKPAPNALVSGGEALVRADGNGYFTLQGVPLGSRTFSAGIERNPAAGIAFPRLGSTTANIIPGTDNFIVIKFSSSGRIFGKVLDVNGVAKGGVRIAIPIEGGFFWTDADGQGNYVFENLSLGAYTLSAPANAVFNNKIDVRALNEKIRSGNQDEILEAFQEAITVFVGANDPLLTGAQLNFRPSNWGFTRTQLRFDGESVEANIRYIAQGSVYGKVINHQGVPIGARVRLTGLGPAINGEPKMTIRGDLDSDPATGLFIFPGQLLAGPWTLQAASPFYPVILTQSGFTTEIDPNVTNVVMQFPATREVNGRLAGRVLNPDGSPVGQGVKVKISFSDDYEIQTGTNGVFDTQIALPAGGYSIKAFDPISGLQGIAYTQVQPGITNFADVTLLTKSSGITVTVLKGNGQPASGAQVDLEQGSFPRDPRITLIADASGRVTFSGLWEGSYAVCAQYLDVTTRLYTRAGVTVGARETQEVTVRLGATGIVVGQFVKTDLTTPIEGAEVAIGSLGFASTDADGRFRVQGVPLGTYRLLTSDPVSGAAAQAYVTVNLPDREHAVRIVEGARGLISGAVFDSDGSAFVPGAKVSIEFTDGLTPGRTVTTGPDGRYSFPGAPVGSFRVRAEHPFRRSLGALITGSASGVLDALSLTATLDVQLQKLGTLPVYVFREDGTTPADNVRVRLGNGLTQDTGPSGQLFFADLAYGSVIGATAISARSGNQHSGATGTASISQVGTNAPLRLVLLGSGKVSGRVLGSNGTTPIAGAEVTIQYLAPLFSAETRLAVSSATGEFTFDDVPVGPYRVSAQSVSLAGSVSGDITQHQEVDTLAIRLGDSGTIRGTLVRADGETPVSGIDLAILYASQSTNPGRAAARTGDDGSFEFVNVPLGKFHLTAAAPAFGGLIEIDGELKTNGQVQQLGTLRFDESFPTVLSVSPAPGASGVSITTGIEIQFSEAMLPASITPAGIFLRTGSGTIPVTLELVADTLGIRRVVRMTPSQPLRSEVTYEIIVVAGQIFGSGGSPTGTGPTDLVNRPLTSPVLSRFTTKDNDPPIVLSIFPTNGAVQIDPRSLPRLSFNEAIRSTNFVFRVVGPEGEVPGAASVGLNGQVLSFLPATDLRANSQYSMTVSNIVDLAGNRSTNEPYVSTFSTLDTLGPKIQALRIQDGKTPVAGGTLTLEVILEKAEPGVSVRYTKDFVALGSSTNAPYRVNVTLPQSGTTTLRAIATDLYGNDGPFAELAITVLNNQPPTVTFARIQPTTGSVASGSAVVVDVIGVDDGTVTQLKAIIGGLGANSLITTNGSRIRVQGVVPATSNTGLFQIFAEATDDQGLSSGQQTLTIPITDATLPTVVLTAPADQSILSPGVSLPLVLQLNDNVGVTEVAVNVTGAFTNAFKTAVSPAQTNGVQQVALLVPANAPVNGELVQLSLTVSDAAGNGSLPVTRTLRMPDRTRPTIVSVSPVNGTSGVDVSANLTVTFSEALDSNTVTSASILLAATSGGAAIATTVKLSSDLTTVTIDPQTSLVAETSYRWVITTNFTDVAHNSVDPAVTNEFRTSEFQLVSPAVAQRVVEGQPLKLEAGSATLVFAKVRFLTNGTEFAVIASAPFTTTYTIPLLAALGTNRLTVTAEALDAANLKLASAVSTLTIYSSTEDTDGDGISNADELAGGMDPFTPNKPPSIQFANLIEVIQGVATNLSISATDPDGNLTTLQLRESLNDDRVRLFDLLRFTDNGITEISAAPSGSMTRSATLLLSTTNRLQFYIKALDNAGLSSTQLVSVVVLGDLDADGIPDRVDFDQDGDGLADATEIGLGTNPRSLDTDGDGLPDAVEVNQSNGFKTNPLVPDTDGDGVPDGFEVALGTDPTNPGDGSSVVVIDGRTVTFSGFARLGTLVLTNGAVLTQPTTGITPGSESRLDLSVTTLIVDSSSRIDVSERGYLGGLNGANATSLYGRSLGNRVEGASYRRSGGSYGGLGAFGDAEKIVNLAYGSYRDPQELGSGAGSDQGPAGSGGGRVRITAQSIYLSGQVLANGGGGSRYAGGGSGGSILIKTATLVGNGAIQANGGGAGSESGGGGGGRIAIYGTNNTALSFTNLLALGGNGGVHDGSPGTIYREISSALSELIVDNNSTNNFDLATPLFSLAGGRNALIQGTTLADRDASFVPGSLMGMRLKPNTNSARTFRIIGNTRSYIFTDPADGNLTEVAASGASYSADLAVGRLIVRNGATVELLDANADKVDRRGKLASSEVEISNNARLAHPAATGTSQFGLELEITNVLRIDNSSLIDVSYRGYLGGLSGDNAARIEARTLGNTNLGASYRRSGGSYGGLGAFGDAEKIVNVTYGSYSDPNEVGSGGGSDSGPGGSGGGLVRIKVGTLQLDGKILANGQDGSRFAGGGSGGAVMITADTITGQGELHANGGGAGSESGGGGGGRIALFYTTQNNFALGNLQASGGTGAVGTGGVGTVLARQAGNIPVIVIRSTGRETPLPDFQGEHLLVDGAVVSGKHLVLASLTLTNGAVLTHDAAGNTNEARLEIEVGALTISADSRIDVSGRGYLGGLSGANSSSGSGRTFGNTITGGSTRRNGGSYGGLGAFGDAERNVNNIYGSVYDPNELGSGGGSDSGPAGSGGGVVRITATSVVLEGGIYANGQDGSRFAGAGSGGGIKLTTETLSGSGKIQVNGGNAGSESGGGGGGRLAVYYKSAQSFDLLHLEALGGTGLSQGIPGDGAPGTIASREGSAIAHILIRGQGRETPLPPTLLGDHVIVDGSVVSGGKVTLSSLLLTNGAVLTHDGATVDSESRLDLSITDLVISSDSRIDASARGYLGGLHAPNGASGSGRTFGNITTGGSTRRNGGGYGGLGAAGDAEKTVNDIYGSPFDPNEPGSGGGSDSDPAGNGGGVIRINTTHIIVEGQILANGEGGSRFAGGGSGGAVKITTDTIAGAGRMQVNGGGAGSESGGGGGGRLAIYYNTGLNFDLLKLEALGGSGLDTGAPGTIVTKRGAAVAQITIRGAGRETPLAPTLLGDHVIIDGALISAGEVSLTSLVLTNGAVLTHPGAGLDDEPRLELNVTTLTVASDSRIDVSERGYLGGLRGANGGSGSGRTFGNTTTGGSTRRNGGSYGGLGATGDTELNQTLSYGSFRTPNELGSGGGSDSSPAGNGGGLVKILADTLQLDGLIRANGGDGSRFAGGGSGGGVDIHVSTLLGVGRIEANSGNGGSESGSGGGGRVAIWYQSADRFDLSRVSAFASTVGVHQGSPGTVYFHSPTALDGELLVHAAPGASPNRSMHMVSLGGSPSTDLRANALIDTGASFSPGALIGLKLNPNTNQPIAFTIISNSATTIVTDPRDGDMTAVASIGQIYGSTPVVTRFSVSDGAIVELIDADRTHTDRTGSLRAKTAEFIRGSKLTHSPATPDIQFGLELVVDNALTIDDTSTIDVTGSGYLGGLAPGNPNQNGRTSGNSNVGGSTRRNGGGYGGSGGFGNQAGALNVLYGNPQEPNLPGSGGGSDSSPAGSGGGVIRLYLGSLQLDGSIVSQGTSGSRFAGGGSGGSVWINVGTLSGAGFVRATGGNGGSESGAGGGGRIAIYYQQASSFTFANVTALGGTGSSPGSPGSVVLQQATFVPLPAAPSLQSLPRIYDIQVTGTGSPSSPSPAGAAVSEVVVRWTGEAGQSYTVESSPDLLSWTAMPVAAVEQAAGYYQARITGLNLGREHAFFRVRHIDTARLGR